MRSLQVCMDIRSLTWIGDVFSLFSRIQKKETSNKNEHEIHAKVAIKAWSCPKQGRLGRKSFLTLLILEESTFLLAFCPFNSAWMRWKTKLHRPNEPRFCSLLVTKKIYCYSKEDWNFYIESNFFHVFFWCIPEKMAIWRDALNSVCAWNFMDSDIG